MMVPNMVVLSFHSAELALLSLSIVLTKPVLEETRRERVRIVFAMKEDGDPVLAAVTPTRHTRSRLLRLVLSRSPRSFASHSAPKAAGAGRNERCRLQ